MASAAAAEVGQLRLAEFMFGFGLFCWSIVGSTILFRLFFRPPLPPALTPTLAIEVAPAATAFLALLAINGNRINAEAAAIAGYGVLMALAQVRLVPAYLRLKFAPSFWAFTFGWAAVASSAIRWSTTPRHPGRARERVRRGGGRHGARRRHRGPDGRRRLSQGAPPGSGAGAHYLSDHAR